MTHHKGARTTKQYFGPKIVYQNMTAPGVCGRQRSPEEANVTPKLYDPTLKALVETEPDSWPALLGRPTGPTDVIDADIATVSGAADKVLRVSADPIVSRSGLHERVVNLSGDC